MSTETLYSEDHAATMDATMARKPSRWLRKTKLCIYNLQKNCSLGSNCLFAHSMSELQDGPDLYKTQLCTRFMDTGKCDNPDCTFAHGQEELNPFPALKQKLCKWHRKGKCRNGENCSFAHGRQDLAGDEAANAASAPPKSPPQSTQPPVQRPTLEQAIGPPSPSMQVGPFATPVIAPIANAAPIATACASTFTLADAMAMPSPKVVFYSKPQGQQWSGASPDQQYPKRTPLTTRAIPYVPLTACQTVEIHAVQNSCTTGGAFALPLEFEKNFSQDMDDSDNKSTSADTAGYLTD